MNKLREVLYTALLLDNDYQKYISVIDVSASHHWVFGGQKWWCILSEALMSYWNCLQVWDLCLFPRGYSDTLDRILPLYYPLPLFAKMPGLMAQLVLNEGKNEWRQGRWQSIQGEWISRVPSSVELKLAWHQLLYPGSGDIPRSFPELSAKGWVHLCFLS